MSAALQVDSTHLATWEALVSICLPIITVNHNEPNAPVKTHNMANEIFKVRTHLFAAYRRLASELETHILNMRVRKIFHASKNVKKARIVIASDKTDLKYML